MKAERATPLHTLEDLTEPATDKHETGKPAATRRFKEQKPTLTRLTARQATEVLGALGTLAIALGAVAALTRMKPVWIISSVLGLVGIVLFVLGFLK